MPGQLPPEVPPGVFGSTGSDGPTSDQQDRNGGVSQGGGIDGYGSRSWDGHHSGMTLGNQAMHSSGQAGPVHDAGLMAGLPGPDGNVSYDGSEVRQGY